MININIIPKTDKGIVALQEHIKSTSLVDKFRMKMMGITQEVVGNNVCIVISNTATTTLKTYAPEKLDKYITQNICKLTKEINKLGVVQNIDYSIEVLS
jgi:cell fate (sporulation/competence/biofilm development) regulator YmcA (YheA/YmcA/DUF963 family)